MFSLYSIDGIRKNLNCAALAEKFKFNSSFDDAKDYQYTINDFCIHLFFIDFISHISFYFQTTNNRYYQLDLRIIGSPPDWIVLLQRDDFTQRLRKKYIEKDNCIHIPFRNVNVIQDVVDLAKKFIHECTSYKFYFKFATDLESIDEWKEMIDYEHEKAARRVNCFSFTDYLLKEMSTKEDRDMIFKEVFIRGEKLMKEAKKCCKGK